MARRLRLYSGPGGTPCRHRIEFHSYFRYSHPMTPILYSFRRCPYAMRARLAIAASSAPVHLREVVLRDKPEAFLKASPTATVPCLVTENGPIDESLDIMKRSLIHLLRCRRSTLGRSPWSPAD